MESQVKLTFQREMITRYDMHALGDGSKFNSALYRLIFYSGVKTS